MLAICQSRPHHLYVIVPVGSTQGLTSAVREGYAPSSYPCFYPAGYAIDTVIPIVNVHQAEYWGSTAAPHGAGH